MIFRKFPAEDGRVISVLQHIFCEQIPTVLLICSNVAEFFLFHTGKTSVPAHIVIDKWIRFQSADEILFRDTKTVYEDRAV